MENSSHHDRDSNRLIGEPRVVAGAGALEKTQLPLELVVESARHLFASQLPAAKSNVALGKLITRAKLARFLGGLALAALESLGSRLRREAND